MRDLQPSVPARSVAMGEPINQARLENKLHRAFLASILEYSDYRHDGVDPKDVLRAIEGRAQELDQRLAVSVHERETEFSAAPQSERESDATGLSGVHLANHPAWPSFGPSAAERHALPDSLRRLEREIYHYRNTGRGIQFLIDGLLEALEGARQTAERLAPLQISHPEVVERLRCCRDWLMRRQGESLPYSPAQIAVAIDAAIEELPQQAPPLSATTDLLHQLELAVNQLTEFGLTREAQGHVQVVHAMKAAMRTALAHNITTPAAPGPARVIDAELNQDEYAP
jgi:hypothetical protein